MPKRFRRTFRSMVYLDTYLHLHGSHELRVENCMKILEYHDILVRLRTRDMEISIWGTDLRVYDFNDSSVLVRGNISSVGLQEMR